MPLSIQEFFGRLRWDGILPAVVIILASLLFGWILHRYVFFRSARFTRKTSTKWDDILIGSLKGIIIVWSTLVGAIVALKTSSLSGEIHFLLLKGIVLVAIFSGILFAVRFARRLIDSHAESMTGVPTTILKNILIVVLYIIGFMIMLDYLGISITPILTALGVGGLAVALALQDTLSNMFSGVHILITKKIKPGDYIQTDSGYEGYVVDISWRNTIIRELCNNMIVIPNSKLAASVVRNYDLPDKNLAVLVELSVAYDSDLTRVETVTKETAKNLMQEVAGGIPEFDPFIRYHTFGQSGIGFTIILRAKEFVDQYLLKHEFIKHLHVAYQREKIEIPFPIRTLIIKHKIEEANHGLG
jgi:small-conductance mechanosensitive channel